MSKKIIYWLGAVDGTNSFEMSKEGLVAYSHISKIYNKFISNLSYQKIYSHGPGLTDFEAYSNSKLIIREIMADLKKFLTKNKIKLRDRTVKICLIGYSRGAVICIDLVKKIYDQLNIKTHFLGLLDPVDRSPRLSGVIYDHAVNHVFIARRSMATSRTWMSYAGVVRNKNGSMFLENPLIYKRKYKIKYYETTHGGMGGFETYAAKTIIQKWIDLGVDGAASPTLRVEKVVGKDITGVSKTRVNVFVKNYGYSIEKYHEQRIIIRNEKEEISRSQSQSALDDLLNAAKQVNIPLT